MSPNAIKFTPTRGKLAAVGRVCCPAASAVSAPRDLVRRRSALRRHHNRHRLDLVRTLARLPANKFYVWNTPWTKIRMSAFSRLTFAIRNASALPSKFWLVYCNKGVCPRHQISFYQSLISLSRINTLSPYHFSYHEIKKYQKYFRQNLVDCRPDNRHLRECLDQTALIFMQQVGEKIKTCVRDAGYELPPLPPPPPHGFSG